MIEPESPEAGQGLDEAAGTSGPSDQPYWPKSWEIAFVQDCNLRCGYCCTGYGRNHQEAAVMQSDTWGSLVDLIVNMSAGQQQIDVHFSTGETFLYFDQAMAFLDRLRGRAAERNIALDTQIITNGTIATEDQLRTCLKKRISLCFSIDGPESRHDRFRRTSKGEATHQLALENWRKYREIVSSVPDGPGCDLYSVIAGESRLREVAAFWREQGAKRFKALPVEPNKMLCRLDTSGWQTRRSVFLADLEQLAFSESLCLRGRSLSEGACVPAALRDTWLQLERADTYGPCGAGYTTIGVDASGNLYPCTGFAGFSEHIIGNVTSGVAPARVAAFRAARTNAQSRCGGCWARFLCCDGCCASDPKAGVVLDAWGECEFFKSFAEIAIRTFQNWRDGLPPKAMQESE